MTYQQTLTDITQAAELAAEASTTTEKLRAALAQANGRRRQRTIDFDQLITEIGNAASNHKSIALHGGHVARAYNYPSSATCALVAPRADGGLAICIGVTSASKGSSARPPQLRPQIDSTRNDEQIRKWADGAQTDTALNIIVFTAKDIAAFKTQ